MSETETATEKRWMTVEEVAEYIGFSPRTIYNRTGPRAKNPFPVRPRRLGKAVRFDKREIDRYFETQ